MSERLPVRPHLDHLRRQAKALLATLQQGDPEAAATFQEYLPAALEMTSEQVRKADFRLADAQSAVARKMGFASWPQLARHVETLRALEGTWSFERLVIAGNTLPAIALAASRILIDGDRFRTESPEAIYEGVFNIDVEAEPHAIDIEFVEGPESGNTNHGIFRLDGDTLEICLDISGEPRPTTFHAAPGTQHAFEVLRRSSRARPESVTGGTPQPRAAGADGDGDRPFRIHRFAHHEAPAGRVVGRETRPRRHVSAPDDAQGRVEVHVGPRGEGLLRRPSHGQRPDAAR